MQYHTYHLQQKLNIYFLQNTINMFLYNNSIIVLFLELKKTIIKLFK